MLDIAAMSALTVLLLLVGLRTDDMWLSLLCMLGAFVAMSFTANIIGAYLQEHYNDWDKEDDDAAEK